MKRVKFRRGLVWVTPEQLHLLEVLAQALISKEGSPTEQKLAKQLLREFHDTRASYGWPELIVLKKGKR